MNKNMVRLLFSVIFILLLASCNQFSPAPVTTPGPGLVPAAQTTESLPATVAPLPQATALVEFPTETLGAVVPGTVLLQDDFSDPTSGWAESSTSGGTMGYIDGGYHISVDQIRSVFSSAPRSTYADVSVEVDGRMIVGVDNSGDNQYGLICRYQDQGNFYGASISSDGFYGFFEFINGQISFFGRPGWGSGGSFNPGDASNHFRLDCVGNHLSLYVNGQLIEEKYVVAETTSRALIASGDVGLYVHSSTPGTDFLFDNFVVTQP